MGTANNKILPLAINYLAVASTEAMTSADIKKEFYKQACDFSFSCTKDQTVIGLSGLAENMRYCVKIMYQLFHEIKPDEQTWKLYLNRVLTEREIEKQDPNKIHSMLGEYVKYEGKNPANDVLSNDELKNLNQKEVILLLHQLFSYPYTLMYYGPVRSIITADEFGAWGTEKLDIPSPTEYVRNKTVTKTVYYTNYDKVQTDIGWYIPLNSITIDQLGFVRYFNEYFGSGMSSLVFQDIRESKALAYSAYAYVSKPSTKNEPFEFIGYVGSQADKLFDAVQAMNELITKVPFLPKNAELARNSILGRLRTERIRRSAYMNTYLSLRRIGLDKDPRFRIFSELTTTDDKGIYIVAKSLMISPGMSLYIVGPKDKVNDSKLAGWGKPVYVPLDKIFGYE
jgi:predicted Zn-dependent peptidase